MKQIYLTILFCIATVTMVIGQGSPSNLPANIKTASQTVAPTSSQSYTVS